METVTGPADAAERVQAFAHRLVEFADYDKCVNFSSVLMQLQAVTTSWGSLQTELLQLTVLRTPTGRQCCTSLPCPRTYAMHNSHLLVHELIDDTDIGRYVDSCVEELVATAERKQKLQKVIDQPNVHGDTGTMLFFFIRVTYGWMELTSAMCSAYDGLCGKECEGCAASSRFGCKDGRSQCEWTERSHVRCSFGEDPRPGAPSIEEMMERSAVIVRILLAKGAEANVTEKAGGNTALHLAVLSENPDAVESLIKNAAQLDVTLRNKAEKTALDLSRQMSGVVSAQMEDLLNSKWLQYEKEAAQMSAQVEQELMDLAVKEVENASNPKTCKKKNKKTKKKVKASEGTSMKSTTTHARWMMQILKPTRTTKKPQHKRTTNKTKKIVQTPTKTDFTPQATQEAQPKLWKAAPLTSVHNSPWGTQPTSKPTKATTTPSPRSQVTSEDDENESTTSVIPYDVLNGSFHRTFPVAAELEIDVEKFLIASSVSDRELEPNGSLSISQVEALQEAHWQARSNMPMLIDSLTVQIELTRVLEAQRVEAQFTLQQELMQLK
ncbi:Ankyrin repeat-containing domain [Phytophthora cactorum]|nr:Ankyrin repeat-containing domain [Phytophthora cactorum]